MEVNTESGDVALRTVPYWLVIAPHPLTHCPFPPDPQDWGRWNSHSWVYRPHAAFWGKEPRRTLRKEGLEAWWLQSPRHPPSDEDETQGREEVMKHVTAMIIAIKSRNHLLQSRHGRVSEELIQSEALFFCHLKFNVRNKGFVSVSRWSGGPGRLCRHRLVFVFTAAFGDGDL